MRLFFTIYFFAFVGLLQGQVNLQMGAAEQAFPLIDYNDAKSGISLGINLNYSSGNGLLVNDIASNVGTGWNLDAGGAIVRIQNGEPDDQPQFYTGFFWADINDASGVREVNKNYPPGYLYNVNTGPHCNVGLNFYPVFKKRSVYKELNKVAADMEQDKFVFRMNGRSGVFIIGKDWKATTLGDSKIKIAIDTANMLHIGVRTRITTFTLTTEDGIRYTFNDKAFSTVLRYKNANLENGVFKPKAEGSTKPKSVNRMWGFPLESYEYSKVINSWFLSEIENTNTKEKVTFTYQDIQNELITSKVVSHQRDLNNSIPIKFLDENKEQKENGRNLYNLLIADTGKLARQYSYNEASLDKLAPGTTTLMYVRSVVATKRLSRINLPNGGKVEFIYHTQPRIDFDNEYALSRIDYFSEKKFIRSYEMEYGYFFQSTIRKYVDPFTGAEKRYARLCLLSIRKVGDGRDEVSEPPYSFDYFYRGEAKSVSRDEFVPARNYLAQDHWGYYNGLNSGLSLDDDHDWLSDESNQYLKTVLYNYKLPKVGYAKLGLLKSVTYPTGGTLTYTYEQNRRSTILGNAPSGGVSVASTNFHDGEDSQKDITTNYKYVDNHGNSSRWGYEEPTYYSFSVTDNNQKLGGKKFKYPGYSYPEMATSVDWSKVITKAVISGTLSLGVGIAVQFLPAAAIPIVNAMVFAATMIKFFLDALVTSEYHRFILSNVNNKLANPFPEQFSTLEVSSNSPTGYNGKTIYYFTSLTDRPPLIRVQLWPYVPAQRLLNWAYSLPKRIVVFDKTNTIINETINNYETKDHILINYQNINCKCATDNRQSIGAFHWDEYEQAGYSSTKVHWMTPRPYFFHTGRTDLVSTTEKNYKNGAIYYSNTINYINDPATLLQKGKMIQKDKNMLVKEVTYFPTDYTIAGSAVQMLKDRNAIHVPVSKETWLTKIGSGQNPSVGDFLIEASVTEFKIYTFSNGSTSRQEVKPWKIYTLKASEPVPYSAIGAHQRSVLLRAPGYFHLQKEMIYDGNGNLIETIENDAKTAYVHDYKERHVVATAVNAANYDIAYTSFEADGKGGFAFDNAGITLNSGVTGNKCFLLNPSRLVVKSGLNSSETYIVTYWRKDNGSTAISILGTPGELLFEGPDNWKLYQHEITGYSTISIAGNAFIDEVRIYPKGAMMSTSTFEEGVGKTSDADLNNHLTFYEYDALGRLKLVRDEMKNVIKTYEYNFVK